MKKIAILIPVFNRLENTKQCIAQLHKLVSLASFRYSDFTIVLIDDGSSDGTSDWLAEHHPEVLVLQGDGNLWWSGGINMGARYALDEMKADYVLLWNNDILAADDYFQELDALVGQMDGPVILGSKIYFYGDPKRENLIWSYGGYFNPRNGKRGMYGYEAADTEEYLKPKNVDWLPGMGTLVPVEVLRTVGLWDAKVFPQYHGDSDYTLRAKKAGYTQTVYGQLRIFNDSNTTGLDHGGNFKGLWKACTDIRSNLNIRKACKFYRRHARSPLAYQALLVSYAMETGSVIKYKLGLKKKEI